MSPLFRAICGKNFGDEGKGLLTDYLAGKEARTLVVRHNGGAQSGHTVLYKGHRFVFHELSSGSFRGAATYWAKTFYPDLYKLAEELTAFANLSAFRPTIYADPLANITIIDDVFLKAEHRKVCGDGLPAVANSDEVHLLGSGEGENVIDIAVKRRGAVDLRTSEILLIGK